MRRTNSPQLKYFSDEFLKHEQTAVIPAAALRGLELAASTPEFAAKRPDREAQLNAAVNAAFAARQKLQKAETNPLGGQLEHVEAGIKHRGDIRERIVAQRVAERLRSVSEDAWDGEPAAGTFARRSAITIEDNLDTDPGSSEANVEVPPLFQPN